MMIAIAFVSLVAFLAVLVWFGPIPCLWTLFGSNIAVTVLGLLLSQLEASAYGAIGASVAGVLILIMEALR